MMPGGAQGFVSGDCGRTVLFPGPAVLADGDDRPGLPLEDGGVAAAGVIGAIGRHRADLFTLGDLVEQFWQHRTVTIATGGEFHGADVRRGGVHGQMDLAPLASALDAMLAHLPFAITEKLDACAVHEQVQGAIGAPIGDLDGEGLLPSAQGGVVGHGPVQSAIFSRLATIPVVCLSGNLNRTLIVRQNWIAASENTAGRPGLPSGGASQVISLSSQTSNEPRFHSEAV